MVSLHDGILSLYPAAKFFPDGLIAIAEEPDRGQYIAHWDNTLGPQPTVAQCLAAPAPQPSTTQKAAAIGAQIEALFDVRAVQMGYRDFDRCALYANDPTVPKWQAEGLALRTCHSLTWQKLYQIQADVLCGLRAEPTLEQILSELPAWVRPVAP
jgi:hypothetical protein